MAKASSRCFVLLFLMLAVLGSVVCYAGNEDSGSSESLIAQARRLQEIWTDGTPPIRMRTEIKVLDAKGKVTPGQYIVTWLSSSRWREQLEFSNYKLLRVHDSKGYWQQSTLAFQPEIIFQLNSLLDFKNVLKIGAKQFLGKVKTRDKDGVRQKCVDVKWASATERTLCFDEATGNLLSVDYPRSENQNPPDISRVDYSAFNMIGDKRIPFEFHVFRDRAAVVAAKVLDITPIIADDPALFVAPTNSEFWPQCDDMQNPELVNKVQPSYPTSARANREQGRVIFYAIVESDGSLSHLTLIQRATPALESSAAIAVQQWRYKPAACGSTPIHIEISIPVDFWLR